MYIDNGANALTQGRHALTPADTHGALSFTTIMNEIVSGEFQCGSKQPFPIVFENDKLPWGQKTESPWDEVERYYGIGD